MLAVQPWFGEPSKVLNEATFSMEKAANVSTPVTKPASRLSAGIATIKHKAAVISCKATKSEFCDSFGDKLSDLGGQCRWAMIGHGLQLWLHDLSQRINELMYENEGVIFKGFSIRGVMITRHCWMLGPTIDYAHPTVVICCDKSLLLKRFMRVILKQGVLGEKGFVLKGIPACNVRLLGPATTPPAKPPRRRSLEITSPQSKTINPPFDQNACFPCGASLVVTFTPREEPFLRPAGYSVASKYATLGGIIMLDGRSFGLTVRHFLEYPSMTMETSSRDQEIILYDSDWALDDPSESEEDCIPNAEVGAAQRPSLGDHMHQYAQQRNHDGLKKAGSSKRNLELKPGRFLEHGILRADASSVLIRRLKKAISGQDRGQNDFETKVFLEKENNVKEELSVASTSLVTESPNLQKLDWALLELPDDLKGKQNYMDPARYPLAVEDIEMYPPQGEVVMLTRRGKFYGMGAGSASSIKPSGSDTFVDVWSLRTTSLDSGDSGSWVISPSNNKLLGVIIADGSKTEEAFVVPAKAIFADIQAGLGAKEVRLPRCFAGNTNNCLPRGAAVGHATTYEPTVELEVTPPPIERHNRGFPLPLEDTEQLSGVINNMSVATHEGQIPTNIASAYDDGIRPTPAMSDELDSQPVRYASELMASKRQQFQTKEFISMPSSESGQPLKFEQPPTTQDDQKPQEIMHQALQSASQSPLHKPFPEIPPITTSPKANQGLARARLPKWVESYGISHNNEEDQVAAILRRVAIHIWRRIQAEPVTYLMDRDEFAIFDYYQNRSRDSPVARRAVERFWKSQRHQVSLELREICSRPGSVCRPSLFVWWSHEAGY